MPSEAEIDAMSKRKGLKYPRVRPEDIDAEIEKCTIKYVDHVTSVGKIFRWCILTLENGFCVYGEPSVAFSKENDDEELGKKIAFDNARKSLWGILSYSLQEKAYQASKN